MKKILLFACLCISLQSFAIWEVIKGNGVAKTETRDASDYTSVAAGGPISVDISYGASNTIQLEGDENILPYIETYVKDNELTIKVKDRKSINPRIPLKVHISMTTINGLAQSGSGNISGSGDFSGTGTTAFAISGSGALNLKFNSFTSAAISMSGSGSVKLDGTIAGDLDISQSGSGSINCEHTQTLTVNAKISGSGNLRINASKSIDAHISGSGHIYYTGAATVNSKVSGSGKVEKI